MGRLGSDPVSLSRLVLVLQIRLTICWQHPVGSILPASYIVVVPALIPGCVLGRRRQAKLMLL